MAKVFLTQDGVEPDRPPRGSNKRMQGHQWNNGLGLWMIEDYGEERRWVRNEQPAPRILWHYTGIQGLLGIVGQGEFRGSQLGYQNDEQEHLLGVSLAQRLIADETQFASWRTQAPSAVEWVRERLEDAWGLWPKERYLICFTAGDPELEADGGIDQGDSLTHWRSYGSGGSGGYALGFDGDRLRTLGRVCQWELGQCVYEEADQRALVRESLENAIADRCFQEYSATIQGVPTPTEGFNNYLFSWAAIIKHRAFREEMEWRLFTRPLGGPYQRHFRPGAHNLIPYTHLAPRPDQPQPLPDWNWPPKLKDFLVEVVVGPGPSADRALRACEAFMAQEAPDVKVRASEVPYRDW